MSNPLPLDSTLYILLVFLSIVAAGLIAGLLGSLTGLGGGTILVPILTLFYGIPLVFATGASLISTIATSAGSASSYVKERISNVKVGIALAMASTLGAVAGSLILVLAHRTGFIWVIYIVFGVVLLGTVIPTIRRTGMDVPDKLRSDRSTGLFQLTGKYFDRNEGKNINYSGIRMWPAIFLLFFAGVLAGLLGIGGGAVNVIGMDVVMNLPMKVATTTSNFMVGFTAAAGSSIYWFQGFIQPFIAAGTTIGVLMGAYTGSKILMRISSTNIRWIFFWVLSFLGFDMVLKGLNTGNIIPISSLLMFVVSILVSTVTFIFLYSAIKRRTPA